MPNFALPVNQYRYDAYSTDDVTPAKDLWVDWYNKTIFQHEGKYYTLLVSILLTGKYPVAYVTLVGGKFEMVDKVNEALASLESSSRTPFTHYKEIQPGDIELEHFFGEGGTIQRYNFEDIIFEDQEDGSLRVALGPAENGVNFIYKPDGTKVISARSKPIDVDIVMEPKAPAFWWGNKEHYDAPWAMEMTIRGTEELCETQGKLNYEGKEMVIDNGISVVEHVWIKKMDWMDWRYMDWVWIHDDNMKALISRYEMSGDYHWEWGTLYLPKEDKHIHCTSCKFHNEELAWSPEHMRFIPVRQTAVCETDEGTLELSLEAIAKPIKRTGNWDPEYLASGIQGWVFTFFTAVQAVKGTFTFNDGRVVEIDGIGNNEPQAVSPIT